MLTRNEPTALYLSSARYRQVMRGLLLWLAVALHAVVTLARLDVARRPVIPSLTSTTAQRDRG